MRARRTHARTHAHARAHTKNKVNVYTCYTHDNYVGCHNLVNSKVTTISRNSETIYVIVKT